MAVINATDNELRSLVFDNKRVLVKFIDAECRICKALAPELESLSEQARYSKVVFLRVDAATNPVSAEEVRFTKAPFFAAYLNGRLIECGVHTTVAEVEKMLKRSLCK